MTVVKVVPTTETVGRLRDSRDGVPEAETPAEVVVTCWDGEALLTSEVMDADRDIEGDALLTAMVMTAGGVPEIYVIVGPGGCVTKIVLGGPTVVGPEGKVV